MVRATSTRVCSPPALPEYLKNVHDLKPILGVPSDDEVKAVHAVIRAAQTVSQVPGMFDSELSMNLAQHLFEVQMGTVIDILDVVHTPPSLPSHVPISLKPIRGVPSDEELQNVHAAMRAYDQMSIIPSMFDPNMGTELSQHLFNIQFTRYMDQAPRGELTSKSAPRPSARTQPPVDLGTGPSDEEAPLMATETITGNVTGPPQSAPEVQSASGGGIAPTATERGPEWIPEKLLDTMEIVKVLINCQQSHARFIRKFCDEQDRGNNPVEVYEVMNENGQLPSAKGLPLVESLSEVDWFGDSSISDSHLARYLQFYGAGADLVEEGTRQPLNGTREKQQKSFYQNI